MNPFRSLANHFSNRGKALSLYKRGMAKARKHDHAGAIIDYTALIGMADTPVDVKAMVLYNRALAHVAAGDNQQAVDDLGSVMAMDDAPVNVRTMCRQKLLRMESRSDKQLEANA